MCHRRSTVTDLSFADLILLRIFEKHSRLNHAVLYHRATARCPGIHRTMMEAITWFSPPEGRRIAPRRYGRNVDRRDDDNDCPGLLLILAVRFPIAAAPAQQGRPTQAALPTCKDVHQRCVARVDPRDGAGCDGYDEEAKRTGIWPPFRQTVAVACAR